MNGVYDALVLKEKMRHLVSGSGSQAKSLVVCGRNQDRNLDRSMRDRSKSRYAKKTCHFYKKNGHIRVDYYT